MSALLSQLLSESFREAAQYRQTKQILQELYRDLFSEVQITNECRIQVLNRTVHQLQLVSSPYLQALKNRLMRQLRSVVTNEQAREVLKPAMEAVEQLDLNTIQSEEYYQQLVQKRQEAEAQQQQKQSTRSYKPPMVRPYLRINHGTDALTFFLNQNLNQLSKINNLLVQTERSDRRIHSELGKTARETRKLSTSQYLRRSDFITSRFGCSSALPGKPTLE